jgi:hypothetical protein
MAKLRRPALVARSFRMKGNVSLGPPALERRATPMFDRTQPGFVDFIRESNRIEGILRDPTEVEIAAHERLLKLVQLHPTTVGDFQAVIAPRKPLRERPGMNVRVGNHIAPREAPISSADFSASSAKRMTPPVVPGVSTSPSKRFIPTWTATDLPEGYLGLAKCKGWGTIRSRCRSCIGSIIRRWTRTSGGHRRATVESFRRRTEH